MGKIEQHISWFMFISIISITVGLIISCDDSNSPTNPGDTQATFFVATTGNDDNTCTAATTPCKTITRALSRARLRGGDNIIQVAEGIYDVLNGEQFPLNPPAGTTIIGTTDRVSIEVPPNGGNAVWIGSPRVTLQNLRISAWNDPILVERVAADVTITDCRINSDSWNGVNIREGSAIITNTSIMAYDAGVEVKGITEAETNATLTNTTIISTHDHAVNVGSDCTVAISDSVIVAQPEDPDNSSIAALYLQNNANTSLTNTRLTRIGTGCALKCYTTIGSVVTNGGNNVLTPPYNPACKCEVTPSF